jgi:UDP-glucose 4-epimerase
MGSRGRREIRVRVFITGGAGFLGSHLADALLARGDEVTVLDSGSTLKVRHLMGKPGFRYEDIPRRVPDVTKMREILGVEATTSLEEGLRHTIDWFRQQGDWDRPQSLT